MIISKKEIEMVMNISIGDRLNHIAKSCMENGIGEGFNHFTDTLKDMTKEFFEKDISHKMNTHEKLKQFLILKELLAGLCDTFGAGMIVAQLDKNKIVKPGIKLVKEVNKSKLN